MVRTEYPDVKYEQSPFGEYFVSEIKLPGRMSCPVLFFRGGWGKISAAASTQYVIDRWNPSCLINLGTCGGFAGSVERGTIVLADRTIVYDIIERMGDPEDAIEAYTTDIDLGWLQGSPPVKVLRAPLVSADQDLDPKAIPALRKKYKAVAGDWESGAIASIAQKNGTRLLILRGVTDLVDSKGGEAYGRIEVFEKAAETIMKRLLADLPAWLLRIPEPRELVALADLVGPDDPLSVQDLLFDARFARLALEYLRSGDRCALYGLAKLPASDHLLRHARNFDYDVPKDSAEALVRYLLSPRDERAQRAPECEQSLAFFTGPMLDDPRWVGDALGHLPADFRFHGALFLTFGYDIGVAIAPTASLNGAHPHFDGHPRELLYYAIHELHHIGFQTYQPPPRLADLKTCGDLLKLVEYSTQMEGMAVLAAYERRRQEGALSDDGDYVALEDEKRMQRDEVEYFTEYDYLKKREAEPADKDAWAVIDRMSSGERLWYRVGARLAQRIEQAMGRPALVSLIRQGPRRFMETCRGLPAEPKGEAKPPAH